MAESLFTIKRRGDIVGRSLKKSKILLFYCSIALLLAGAAGFWFNWATGAKSKVDLPVGQAGSQKIFVIQRGERTDSIIKRLHQEGFIKSLLAFKLLLYKEGLKGKIQAGDFRFSSSMSALEIAQELTHGTLDRRVTIIEGWRSEEIASIFNFHISEKSRKEGFSIFKEHEGYLFPDTYLIPQDASAGAVIKILKKNFDQKIESLLSDIQKSDLSLKQIIILASIVEREAKHDQDRPIVAGILVKRWQNGWLLQVDATIQYLIGKEGEWWPKVKKADLKVDSPYNTYLYPGLPPAPICNPSLSTIKAVIYPEQTDYWYYLSDKEGKMRYAKTLEEHNQNIRRYL